MKKRLLILLFLVLICSALVISQNNNQLTKEQKEWVLKANRQENNGWIFVHLEGAPEAVGFQHGYLLANEILNLREAMIMLFEKSTKKNWDFYRNESTRMFWTTTPEEYQKEIDGILLGVNSKLGAEKIDRSDIFAMNAILEIAWYYVPWLETKDNPNPPDQTPPGHCSAFAATGTRTTDGKIVMAHNNWVDYVIGQRWNIILDVVPEKGNRIIMDALPGCIHSGDDFYINSSGLIVTETTISKYNGYDITGVAEFVRARKAIQYSSSIDEWVKIMKVNNTGGYANDWIIGDNKSGEIARLELGLKNQILERTKNGYFVGANFPVNEKFIKEETTYDASLLNTSPVARKIRWEAIMKDYKGKIDIDAAMKFMGDHHDTWQKTDKASVLTLCCHGDADQNGDLIIGSPPFYPAGAVQGKATDGTLAKEMKLWAIIGHPCGESFIAKDFLAAHPEFDYQQKYLRDMPGQKWTLFGKITK